jgi:replicative DNA helicase
VTDQHDHAGAVPPPHNIEAEQGLIGALLADNSIWPLVRSRLRPEHFFEPVHARLYEAVDRMAAAGKVASFITIKNTFDQDETLIEIGGTKYLAQLVAHAAPPMSAEAYAELLCDLAARRSAMLAARELMVVASTIAAHESFRPAIASHIHDMQRLFDEGGERRTSFTIGEAATAMVDRVKRMRAGEADPNAIKTHIASIDKFTGGLHRGEYIILGGRPSMGKTALATQIAYNVSERRGGVFYASLEMPVPLITPRFASCRLWGPEIAVDYQSIIRGQVDERTMRWLESAADELKTWPLIIDDAAGLTAAEIEARAQIAKAKFERSGTNLSLIVVDHIHKMHHPGAQSKVTEYTEISARLAEMAKRLDCPVLALAQLNRGVEARDDKRPQLSDLRESGSIEQDADTVLFVYRPAYYLERKRCSDPNAEADRMADLDAVAHRLELIIEKQRSGPIGTIDLWCSMAANLVRDPSEVDADIGIAA